LNKRFFKLGGSLFALVESITLAGALISTCSIVWMEPRVCVLCREMAAGSCIDKVIVYQEPKRNAWYVLLAELMNSEGKSLVSVGGIGGEHGSMTIVLDASRVLGSMESCRELRFTRALRR
jgi:hypothetical protein